MNACSIAGILLTTQAVMVAADPEEEEEKVEMAKKTRKASRKENLGFTKSGMPAGMTI